MPSADRWRVELSSLAVLLLLIVAQVIVDRFGDDGGEDSLDRSSVIFYGDLTSSNDAVEVLQSSSNCYQCLPTEIGVLHPDRAMISESVSTTFPVTIFMKSSSESCQVTHHFREKGVYHFNVSSSYGLKNCTEMAVVDGGKNSFLHRGPSPSARVLACVGRMAAAPKDSTVPSRNTVLPALLYAAAVLLVLCIVWISVTAVVRCCTAARTSNTSVTEVRFTKIAKSSIEASSIQENKDLVVGKVPHDPFETARKTDPLVSGVKSHKENNPNAERDTATLRPSIITRGTEDPSSQKQGSSEMKGTAKRLESLDTFRGMSLVIMIFVNYGGGGYWFFQHSVWNGLTVADLVFPWFVWIMGVSLVFSFSGRKEETLLRQLYHILRRTLILFALGLFLISNSGGSSLNEFRICGVLQRLAVTYMVVACTELFAQRIYQYKAQSELSALKDLSHNWVQWFVALLLELLWLLLTFLLHHQDCPRGYLGPGGIGDQGNYSNCTGGAAAVIDYWILGEEHLYPYNTAKSLYQFDVRFDPEGVLGTLNSIVLCVLGVQAGKVIFQHKGRHCDIVCRLVAWGVALCALASVLCLDQKNAGLVPINKNLWSLSYILLTSGFAYLLLTFLYLIIDVFPLWTGAPFKYTGMNSILVYLGHELLQHYFPFKVFHEEYTHLTYLSANLIAVGIWVLISYYWFAIHFFVKF